MHQLGQSVAPSILFPVFNLPYPQGITNLHSWVNTCDTNPSLSYLCALVERDVARVDGDDLSLADGVLGAHAALQDDQAVALVNLHLREGDNV